MKSFFKLNNVVNLLKTLNLFSGITFQPSCWLPSLCRVTSLTGMWLLAQCPPCSARSLRRHPRPSSTTPPGPTATCSAWPRCFSSWRPSPCLIARLCSRSPGIKRLINFILVNLFNYLFNLITKQSSNVNNYSLSSFLSRIYFF